MLGFRSSKSNERPQADSNNPDVARLFYDSFSQRVAAVERSMHLVESEMQKMKSTMDSGHISDLVLLERVQKMEVMIKESLLSLQTAIENAIETGQNSSLVTSTRAPIEQVQSSPPIVSRGIGIASHVMSPTGELGSLPSITTPTELQVLTLLAGEGPKSAPEIGLAVGRSREHTARLMKKLYEEGYIRRDQTRIPFRYSIVDRLKQTIAKPEPRDEAKEPVSVPQT